METCRVPPPSYLAVPPSDISRTRPVVRLILNQIARRLTETLPVDPASRRQLLLMLDEFPALLTSAIARVWRSWRGCWRARAGQC